MKQAKRLDRLSASAWYFISESYYKRITDFIKDAERNPDLLNTTKNLPADYGAISVMAEMLTKSYLMGLDRSTRKMEFAEPTAEEIETLPYAEAVEYLKKRDVLNKIDYKKLTAQLKFRAFTASRISDGALLKRINGELIKSIESGEGLKVFLEMTKTDLLNKVGIGNAGGWYWETVYRTNVQTAYNAGRMMGYEQDKPYALELVVIDDARTTDYCRQYAGKGFILPYSDPFWKTHIPPFHFNCRTTIRAIYGQDELPESWSSKTDLARPAKGFGKNPVMNDDWWKELDSQIRQAKMYGVQGEILGANDILIKHKTVSEIKKIGTISKGDAMTFDEADGGKANPFISLGGKFKDNCQSCVAAFEARLRGFKVRAKRFSESDIHFKRLANNPARAFIDPYTRHHPNWLESDVFNTWEDCLNYAIKTVKRGQRYVMKFYWKENKRGHIISAIRTKKGRLFFYDPQDGSIWEKEEYKELFDNILFEDKYKQPQFLRVDHLQLDGNVLQYVLEATDE